MRRLEKQKTDCAITGRKYRDVRQSANEDAKDELV